MSRAAVPLAALLVVAAAGCGGGATRTVTSTRTRTVTTTRTVTAAAPGGGGSTTSAASPPRSSAPACAAAGLRGAFKEVPGSAGAGQISYRLTLENSSSGSCFVSGVPVVQLLDANGNALATHVSPAQPGAGTAAMIVLAPGASASAQARFSPDVPGTGEPQNGPCEPTATTLAVTAPGGGTLTVPVEPPTSVCEHGALRFDLLAASP